MTTETITAIKSEPLKTKSTYGNWVVIADAHFKNEEKEWDYPNKHYYFFTKTCAKQFINRPNLTKAQKGF